MTVVRINAIEVPEGLGATLEERFAARLHAVDQAPGFRGFEMLRPTGEAEKRYFIVTHWATAEDFDNWVNSADFAKGHGHADGAGGAAGGHPGGAVGGHPGAGPVATGSAVLEFEVVLESKPT